MNLEFIFISMILTQHSIILWFSPSSACLWLLYYTDLKPHLNISTFYKLMSLCLVIFSNEALFACVTHPSTILKKKKKLQSKFLIRLFPRFLFVCLKFLENLKFFMKKNQYLDRLPQGKRTSTDKQLEKEVSAVLKRVTPTRVMRQAWMSQGALIGTGCDSEVLFEWGTSFSSWKTF